MTCDLIGLVKQTNSFPIYQFKLTNDEDIFLQQKKFIKEVKKDFNMLAELKHSANIPLPVDTSFTLLGSEKSHYTALSTNGKNIQISFDRTTSLILTDGSCVIFSSLLTPKICSDDVFDSEIFINYYFLYFETE